MLTGEVINVIETTRCLLAHLRDLNSVTTAAAIDRGTVCQNGAML